MWKVIHETQITKYKLLMLDHELPMYPPYTKYNIGGKIYEIVPVYDLKRSIAVETTESLLGKEVKFV